MRAAFAEGSRRGDDGENAPATAMGVQLSTHELRNGNDASSGMRTPDSPEGGRVHIFEVTLSEGELWIDEDAYFIRSTEFELSGQGDTLDEAVEDFIGHA